MTASEIITSAVSVLSLIVATVSWCISHYVNKRMLAIEEKREKDRLEAATTGKVKVVASSEDKRLIISNDGPVDLMVTDIVLNGIEIRKHPCFEEFTLSEIKLPAGNHFYALRIDYELSMERQYLPPYDTLVKWVTKNGDAQQQEMTVNWI